MNLLSYLGPIGIIYLYGILFLLAPYYIFLVREKLVNSNKLTTIYSAVFFILGIYLCYVSPTPFIRISLLLGAVLFVNWKIFKFLKPRPQNTIYKKIFIGILKTIAVMFSLFVTLIVMLLIVRDYIETYEKPIPKTDPNILVEACNKDTENCYTLKAYLIEDYCEIEDYRNRSGYCIDSYIKKIYFDNGGSINMEECSEEGSKRWVCKDIKDTTWSLSSYGALSN